jgi:wyosine [tRNA(Phe)-imidazoG37] synthetase (radical SAM superfamily)
MIMPKGGYRYLYGPVSSWRLGRSLGIDPISAKEKICTFDCVYCQLGRTKILSSERREFVGIKDVIHEIGMLPLPPIDYITFSGAGEPTLAKNLGGMIKAVKKIRKEKIAVIMNSSLMNRRDVQEDLALADFVLAKLDADSEESFQAINRPMPGMNLRAVLATLKGFRSFYKGRLALQIMFTSLNEKRAGHIAQLAKEIRPDEIEINTPLRPCGAEPLSETILGGIEDQFRGICGGDISIINVYSAEKEKVLPISGPDTLRRRGKV